MHRLIRAKLARKDLKSIYQYIKTTNSELVASNYLFQIETIFQLLRCNPKMGVLRNNPSDDIRSIVCQSHVIYYKIEEDAITILRVLHGAREISEDF